MAALILIFVVDAIACGIAGTMIGSKKQAGAEGFLLGFFFGPIGLVLAILVRGDRQPCPYCRELVHPAATRCPWCVGEIIHTQRSADTKKCPACAETIKLEAVTCRFCGTNFNPVAVSNEVKKKRTAEIKRQAQIEGGEICPSCGKPGSYYDYLNDLYCPNCKKVINSSPG